MVVRRRDNVFMRDQVRGEHGFAPSAATTVQSLQLGAVEVRHVRAPRSGDNPAAGYRDPGDDLIWAFTLNGTVSVFERKSDFETPVGLMSMSQLSRLKAFRNTPNFDSISIRLARSSVGLSSSAVGAMSNVAFPGREGLPLVLLSMAREALRNFDSLGESSKAGIAQSLVDLTGAFADDFLGRHTAPEKEQRNLVVRAERFMELYSANPGVGPEDVASAIGVSLRVLQKAFQSQGVTVSGSLLESRLTRARMLLDRESSAVLLGHIGQRAGFTSAQRFSKAFSTRFGQSPRGWRSGRTDQTL
jgi:AraC-like DNA-binding protein